jgi:hypothetical protein
MMQVTPNYIYFFAGLYPNESSDSGKPFTPFMTNSSFVEHSTDYENMVSMIRDIPFTIPIKYGQKLRFQLIRWKTNPDLAPNKQMLDYYPKIKEIMECKHISPWFVHSKGFEILTDFIYTADETNPIQNYQGFEIQFKYCRIPGFNPKKNTYDDTSTDMSEEAYPEQVYMTHPSFRWKK